MGGTGMKLLFMLQASTLVGLPYKYGGKTPIPGEGIDCSGVAQEMLKTVGKDLPGDQTADHYYRHFKVPANGTSLLEDPGLYFKKIPVGALVFYGTEDHVHHVAVSLGNGQMIEAGGGSEKVTNREAAIAARAYVRIRPIRNSELVDILVPNGLPWI